MVLLTKMSTIVHGDTREMHSSGCAGAFQILRVHSPLAQSKDSRYALHQGSARHIELLFGHKVLQEPNHIFAQGWKFVVADKNSAKISTPPVIVEHR
jgi:hypothetical protein